MVSGAVAGARGEKMGKEREPVPMHVPQRHRKDLLFAKGGSRLGTLIFVSFSIRLLDLQGSIYTMHIYHIIFQIPCSARTSQSETSAKV